MAIPVPKPPDDEGWFSNRWRPAMAWQYFVVCLFDFMVAPILMGFYSAYTGDYHPWEPLTLHGGGLYHLSMAAIVGVTVWSRGQEKMLQLNNNDNGGDNDSPHGDDGPHSDPK